MIIANPIHDVLFKYLLEDIDIACELLSAILGVPICSLTLKPQEEVKVTHKFITHLTHESYTIQIPHLKVNQQNQL
jgi:hypothetical protein